MSVLSEDSVFQGQEHNVPIKSFFTTPFIQKNSNFVNDIVNKYLGQNKSINVLEPKNQHDHVTINPQFQQYLRVRNDDRDLVIVTVVGSKGVGKSFILDSLISADSGKTSRVMFQNKSPIVNTSTYEYQAKNNTKVLFFDVNGVTSKQNFLWLYLLSSVFILNLKEEDRDEEEKFLKKFEYVSKRIKVNQPTDLSEPELILVRRDCASTEPKDQQEFLRQIDKTGIFHPDIHHIYLPYPSKIKTSQNKIANLPQMNLDKDYKEGVQSINRLLKNSHPKILKGNFYNSKLLAFSLHPTLDDINHEEQANVDRLWQEIIENYGVQYKEAYMKEYKFRLNNEFRGENPRKQYQVYRLLADIKRKTDKSFIGYQNLEGDPAYEKYHNKVKQQIKEEEEQVIRQNHKLVKFHNSQNCKQKMSKLNPKNYAQLIDDYNTECPCEYEKSDVLLDNFKFFINEKIKAESVEGMKGKKSPQLQALEQELETLNTKIKQSKIRSNDDDNKNVQQLEHSIKQKEDQLAILRKTMIVKKSQNPELQNLEKENKELQQQLKKEEDEARLLLTKKHKKINDARSYLQKQLEDEKMKFSRLQSTLKTGVNVKNAGTKGVDKTCCTIM